MGTAVAEGGEEQEAPESRGFGFTWYLLVTMAVLVVYFLSIGPMARYYARSRRPPAVIMSIYAPLGFLVQHCRPAERLVRWYVLDVWSVEKIQRAARMSASTNSPPAGK